MATVVSAAKTVLLAAHLAAKADVAGLAYLATSTEHGRRVLRTELLLRILLTYLPETLPSAEYVPLIQEIVSSTSSDSATLAAHERVEFDAPTIEALSEEQAAKKVRKLHLLKLSSWAEAPAELLAEADAADEDGDDEDFDNDKEARETHHLLALFLLRRAYRVDEEAGLLGEIPELFAPFLDLSSYLRTWLTSVLLPLLRRNYEYYPHQPLPQTLDLFERLPDRSAVRLLLSQTGVGGTDGDEDADAENDISNVGRDLRGMIGPWLYNDVRWASRKRRRSSVAAMAGAEAETSPTSPTVPSPGLTEDGQGQTGHPKLCPGWEQVLQWLTGKAASSWKVAVGAIEQWDGPGDVDLGDFDGSTWLQDEEQEYLEHRYARAALACAYLVPEASVDALDGVHTIVAKILSLLDLESEPSLQEAASRLPSIPVASLAGDGDKAAPILSAKNATRLRTDLLDEDNPLTRPSGAPAELARASCLSAFLLTRAGQPCTLRRAAELCLLQNEREQTAEAAKLIHSISNNGPKTDDQYWRRARSELLWLRDWGAEADGHSSRGIFGQVKKEFLEVEFLKGLLNNSKYQLASEIYEDAPDTPLPRKAVQDTVFSAAMNAYDNASNPNRTRGGLKKCNDIIHSFPRTVEPSLAATQRVEALLKATHALSEYRLVLKQGEPFTPVVLRVHPDPISIVSKVLEQNPKSYTNIHSLLDLGAHMVEAGLVAQNGAAAKHQHQRQHSQQQRKQSLTPLTPEKEAEQRIVAERRITAMCVDASLTEDDFETAYSYVVNRIGATASLSSSGRLSGPGSAAVEDDWSWKAALQAGKYRRTARTVRPTHLGTTTANAEIRHLEQRIECLSAALRIAPPATLQEILNAFRRCEEELDVAVRAEAEKESAWDEAGEHGGMPGGFAPRIDPREMQPQQQGSFSPAARQPAEEAPLSLFDLSRATARAAQRNFTALSSLQRLSGSGGGSGDKEKAGTTAAAADASSAAMARTSTDSSAHSQGSAEPSDGEPRVRKRDQFREAAVGTLVSGVGWLVGAPSHARGQD